MRLQDIDLSKLQSEDRNRSTVYYDDKFYYKIFHTVGLDTQPSIAYFTLDGLDLQWSGADELAVKKVGLLDLICPAYHDSIYNNGVCVGYVTHRGAPANKFKQTQTGMLKYMKFVKELADISIKTGWGIVSVNTDNMVVYQDQLSFADLEFSPIKLNHGKQLTDFEQGLWENEFRSFDGYYLQMIKNRS
jgi:hypothetical protein